MRDRAFEDAVEFEVLRHRLWTINDGQASVLVRTTGSPVAQEAKDFNCSILGAGGESLFVSSDRESALLQDDSILDAIAQSYYDAATQFLSP